MIAYKSFCWALGTTSFRTTEFNKKVEKQLKLIKSFWNIEENASQCWSSNSRLQIKYYDFLQSNSFVDGNATNKAKDAREKTSGLVDIGLITENRQLTEVGLKLLEISENEDFGRDNILQIDNDSFLFFKQLLKTTNEVDGKIVNPYLVIAGLLQRFGKITKEEFTYLAPLIISQSSYDEIVNKITLYRNNQLDINSIIFDRLMSMDNYVEALQHFLDNEVTEQLILKIGMNRKSSERGLCQYDRPYHWLYTALRNFQSIPSNENVIKIYNAICSISGKASTLWKNCIFTNTRRSSIERDGVALLSDEPILSMTNEIEFKKEFFKLMHVFKAKATLSDYCDLNRRYLKTTDTILFEDNEVKFDVIPQCYFNLIGNNIFRLMFTPNTNLTDNCELVEISNIYNISQLQLFNMVQSTYNITISNENDIRNLIQRERYERFNHLIEQKFSNEQLIELLSMFEERRDNDIKQIVTNNADIPTIFEYIVAIAWYKISERSGDVLNYMNLSLDADLLPKSHAQGGHEDITYIYPKTEQYPAHSLLIEVTLSEGNNQRRMEMEPVSRHLGDYLLRTRNLNSYCVFISNFLHLNVISDFRNRRTMEYYNSDGTQSINGMKIIPCQSSELKTILSRNITYSLLYSIFEQAHNSNIPANRWYNEEIVHKMLV